VDQHLPGLDLAHGPGEHLGDRVHDDQLCAVRADLRHRGGAAVAGMITDASMPSTRAAYGDRQPVVARRRPPPPRQARSASVSCCIRVEGARAP
jgi:hypothetical protein